MVTVTRRVHAEAQSVELTPTADTNGIGHPDPLSDACELFARVSDRLGHLCGIF